MIHCIGDSHVSVFSGQDAVGKEDILPHFKTYRIGPHTAFNIIERKGFVESIIRKNVEPEDLVMFCFGEIDCRIHLVRQSHIQRRPLEDVVSECVQRYFEIFEFAKAYNVRLLAWNVPPPSLDDVDCGEFISYGTFEQRSAATVLFNAILQKLCERNDVAFISVYEELLDEDGLPNRFFFLDNIHLSQNVMPFILDGLKNKGVHVNMKHTGASTEYPKITSNLKEPNKNDPFLLKEDPSAKQNQHLASVIEDENKNGCHRVMDESETAVFNGSNSTEAHYVNAQLCIQANRHEEAIKHLKQVIALDPSHAKAYDDLGVIYYQKNDYPRSLEFFITAHSLDNLNYNAFHNILAISRQLGMVGSAMDLIKTMLREYPDDKEFLAIAETFTNASPGEGGTDSLDRERLSINVVYEHLEKSQIHSVNRGRVSVLWSSLPLTDFDVHVYLNSSSFRGKLPGISVLVMLEPIVTLPGEYNCEVWRHFDHVFSLCDSLSKYWKDYTKILFPRAGWVSGWVNQASITEDVRAREQKYPLENRLNSVCMINGNKRSFISSELYSMRTKAAQWFCNNSDIPFDVYGNPPFALPNYKGALPPDAKLATLSRYKYCLCFENTNHPEFSAGYVSEKILDCMETRTIPIYFGCVNIEEYIPKECYIDFREFGDFPLLDRYLHGLGDKEYRRYIENIDSWVSEGGLRPYSWHTIYEKVSAIYASRTSTDINTLYADTPDWTQAVSLPLNGTDLAPVNSPPMWTWSELANSTSPLLCNNIKAEDSARKGTDKYVLRFQNLKSENGSIKTEFLKELAQVFALDVFVETGTYLGDTSYEASKIFASVHTIELSDELYRKALKRFERDINIQVHHGDSSRVLPDLLHKLRGRPLFWLDGHYSEDITAKGDENTPIIKELRAIKDAQVPNAVILIDDLRYFDTLWDFIPADSAARGYPSIGAICNAIREIDESYLFAVIGDVFMAYPSTERCCVSSVVHSVTVSRLHDDTDRGLRQVIEAEGLIGNAQSDELHALQNLHRSFAGTENYGLCKHYRLWYALTLAAQKNYLQACKQFLIAINLGSSHWRVEWYLARAAYETGYYSLANRSLLAVLQSVPDYSDAQQLAKQIEFSASKRAYEHKFNAQDHYELALHYQNSRRYNAAIEEYKQCLSEDPSNPDFNYPYAKLLAATGQYEMARIEFEGVLGLDANHALAHNDLGEIYSFIQGDPQKGLEHFKQAFRIDNKHYTALTNALGLLIKAGEIQEAINIFRPVFERSPNDPNLLAIAERFVQILDQKKTAAKTETLYQPPKNIQIMGGTQISSDSRIGDYTYIGFNCFITKAVIGRYCSIANCVKIGQGEHNIGGISTSSLFYEDPYQTLTNSDCVIGNDVWIGVDSIIRRGVTIGDGAVIGANSFVNDDIPDYAVAVGSPAKIIKFRFSPERIAMIRESNWWNCDLEDAKTIINDLEESAQKDMSGKGNVLNRDSSKEISVLLFSKDRAMQLDCAIRSFTRHCKYVNDSLTVKVLYTTSNAAHERQYRTLAKNYPSIEFVKETDFKNNLLQVLTSSEYVLFLVDDNIFVNDFSTDHIVDVLRQYPNAIGFSLRLGRNTNYCYMLRKQQALPAFHSAGNGVLFYDWPTAECDFGYPLEVSSSLYRTSDLLPLLAQADYKNPNTLEVLLDTNKPGFSASRDALLCFERSVAFCNPLNIVQTAWSNRVSGNNDYSPGKLAELFDNRYRIDIDAFRGFVPGSCHQEEELKYIKVDDDLRECTSHEPQVSIIILHQNGLENIRLNIESIKRNTPEAHEIIVFDNASSDGSNEYLRSITDLVLIESPENIGCTPARAKAMSIARGKHLILLDNDTIVTKGWVTKFLDLAEKNPHIGLMGPSSNYVSGQQLVSSASYKSVEEMEMFANRWSEEHRDELLPVFRLVGFCMFIRKELFDKIGTIDESLGFFGFDDDDYSLRAYLAGFSPSIAKGIFIHHTGGLQGRGDQQVNGALLDAWELYKTKWGISMEIPYGAPYEISPILAQPFNEQKHFCEPCPKAMVMKMLYHAEAGASVRRDCVFETEMATKPPSFTHAESIRGMTSIIISVSQFDDNLRKCLDSIKTGIAEPYEIILAKIGQQKVPGWLKKYITMNTRCRIISGANNMGYAAICNEALKILRGQYVLFLDGNTILFKGSFERLRECLDRKPEHGITVPMSNNATGPQQIPKTQLMSFKVFEEYAEALGKRNRYRHVETFEMDSFCVLIKRELIDAVGFFNKNIANRFFVMNDYRMRVLLEGYQTVISGDACLYRNRDGLRKKGADKAFREQWDICNQHNAARQKIALFVTIKEAGDYHRKGLLKESVQTIVDGIKRTPKDERLYYLLAEILFEEKSYQESIDVIQAMPEPVKNKARALEILAYCMYYLGNIEEAEDYAGRALSLSGNSAKALNLKGLVSMKQEDRTKAMALFQQAISTDPGFADPYVNIGAIDWHQNKCEEALDFIEKGFILSPETGDFLTTYSSAITSLNEFTRAEQVVVEAVGLFPGNKRLLFLLIDILLHQEKHAEAMKEIEKAMLIFGIDNEILQAALAVREKIGPLAIGRSGNRTGTLSVSMIAKNEEKYIARCLSSISPIADEIIVVDTGSTDRTKDIAKAFGARVYDLPWTDDFSASRNHSLSFAKGQWVLVHDADEVISPLDYDKLKEITAKKTEQPTAYTLTTRTYTNNPSLEAWTLNNGEYPDEEEGTGWCPTIKTRLFRNDNRIRFQNQVHELLEPSLAKAGITIKHCTVPVHHYGKLDQDRSLSRAEMYFELGKAKIMSFQDTKALRELAIQAGELGKHTEALGLWDLYIQYRQDDHVAYFNMSTSYLETGEFEKALLAARTARGINPQSKEAHLGFATSSLCCGDIAEAIDVLESLLEKNPGYVTAIGALAAAYCIGKNTEKGVALLRDMQAKRYDFSTALHSLCKKLIRAGRSECAKALLESMFATGHIHQHSASVANDLNVRLQP